VLQVGQAPLLNRIYQKFYRGYTIRSSELLPRFARTIVLGCLRFLLLVEGEGKEQKA